MSLFETNSLQLTNVLICFESDGSIFVQHLTEKRQNKQKMAKTLKKPSLPVKTKEEGMEYSRRTNRYLGGA